MSNYKQRSVRRVVISWLPMLTIVARVGRNERSELRRMLQFLTFPRWSSPSTAARAGAVREHCLSPNRLFDSGELVATRYSYGKTNEAGFHSALSRHLYVPVRHATPG